MSSILRISEAANLGIHALVYLALERDCSPCSAGAIAKGLEVSESHLAKVMQRLAAAGMVSSTRGARGGFTIITDPDRTSLLQVLEAIDGPILSSGCLLGRGDCLVHCGQMLHGGGTVSEGVRMILVGFVSEIVRC